MFFFFRTDFVIVVGRIVWAIMITVIVVIEDTTKATKKIYSDICLRELFLLRTFVHILNYLFGRQLKDNCRSNRVSFSRDFINSISGGATLFG